MDKKNYFEPEMEIVELKLEGTLLDASDPNIGDDNGTETGSTPGGSDDF